MNYLEHIDTGKRYNAFFEITTNTGEVKVVNATDSLCNVWDIEEYLNTTVRYYIESRLESLSAVSTETIADDIIDNFMSLLVQNGSACVSLGDFLVQPTRTSEADIFFAEEI